MTDILTRFISGALFPIQERLKGHTTVQVRRLMDTSQWWPPDQLDRLRTRRLRALLEHACRHVPYYRDLFARAGLDPLTVHDPADLRSLPFLTKELIRDHFANLTSDQATALSRFTTGGSTGAPLIFLLGRERVSHDVAAKWRATRWWNVDIGDVEAVIWGSPIELSSQDRLRRLRDIMMRTELLPAFEMSESRLDQFVGRLRARRPAMLFGYPSALSRFGLHAERRGIAMDDLGIRVAFVTGERLYDDQRATIRRVFGCPVANGYGSRDAGFIAHECPRGGMHVTAEDVILEVVDETGRTLPPGQVGEIVITHLATRYFPFIRYRTGDRAALDDRLCECGRTLPLLRQIEGRATDFVRAMDGTQMHGLALIYTLRDIPGIAQFKITQESLEHVRVEVVPGAALDFDAATARIRRDFQSRLGARVQVAVEKVSEIAAEKSGKYRYVVSKVAP